MHHESFLGSQWEQPMCAVHADRILVQSSAAMVFRTILIVSTIPTDHGKLINFWVYKPNFVTIFFSFFNGSSSPWSIKKMSWACLSQSYGMSFYWLWDGPLFISVVTDKSQLRLGQLFHYMHTVSWDWGILAIATTTVEIHIYFAFYWDILMLREANWSREICKNCRFFGHWKTSGGHFDSWLGHVNSSAPIRQGVDCFTVSKLQRGSSSFNHSPPLHCLLNKRSGLETAQQDCKAWPCNFLDHFHHKMAGLASHRRLKNMFGCKLLMKRGFYLKSGIMPHGLTLWYNPFIGCEKSVLSEIINLNYLAEQISVRASITLDYKPTSLSTEWDWFTGLTTGLLLIMKSAI